MYVYVNVCQMCMSIHSSQKEVSGARVTGGCEPAEIAGNQRECGASGRAASNLYCRVDSLAPQKIVINEPPPN